MGYITFVGYSMTVVLVFDCSAGKTLPLQFFVRVLWTNLFVRILRPVHARKRENRLQARDKESGQTSLSRAPGVRNAGEKRLVPQIRRRPIHWTEADKTLRPMLQLLLSHNGTLA